MTNTTDPNRPRYAPNWPAVLLALAVIVAVAILAGCASVPPDDAGPDRGTEATEPETTEREPEPVTTRTTEEPTTTTTEPPLTEGETGMLVVALTMCDTYGTDAGFGIDWCAIDPDSSVLADMVSSGCDLIDAIDPYGTMTNDEIIEGYATLAVDAISSGTATYDEASAMATMNGAILAVRTEVCS